MSCSLNIKNMSVEIDGKELFKNISLNVSHKEKIAIIGPNGCGKTTLLETIVGFCPIKEGSIELFHQKINCGDDFKSIRHMVGYLLQDSDNQFLAPIVEDDIAFSLLAQGVDKNEAKTKTDIMLNDLGISHLAKKVVYHLSGGEKKLVALAGVLITEPKLMLLDEPTSGLDFSIQLKLTEILKKIDKSIVIVSHDKEFVESVVDKIYKISPSGLKRMLNSDMEYTHTHDGLPPHTHPHEH
ncbi:MAG: energy-coupling factor ABC transporter ATP-binding protein [Campylobacteraceae bacterium]|jgi:cobalt/nickel transport system ATP-binding protein|nr:energy-coupling factor ABC transporter ATP-binding protein [Campylobacteraceae bacterium]